jgi:hypothetical protein
MKNSPNSVKRPNNFRHKLRKILAEITWSAPHSLLGPLKPSESSVLMYHRVVEPKEVPWEMEPGMYVTPESFR